jgi:hypothetical protein
MSLFNSTLYYTTHKPAAFGGQQNCSAGESRICAVDYLLPMGGAGKGGAAGQPLINTVADPCITLGESIILGPSITQTPTCSEDAPYTDFYLGMGAHNALGNVTPGKFQISVQTGSKGTKTAGSEVNAKTIDLPTPPMSTRIDSWAAVVE